MQQRDILEATPAGDLQLGDAQLGDAQVGDARLREFHALYRGEFAFVWSAARRLGVPPASIEDAVQDVFVTAYRRLEQLRFEVSARAWLYGVTRRVASHYHRGAFRRRRRDAALAAQPAPPREAPQERILRTEGITRLLDRLGPRTRAAWEMSELLGMSGPEIASELGLPLNTVYSRVRLARQQLQRELLAPQALERWIADERAQDAPPERAAQRSWALLLPALGNSGSASGGLGLLTTTRGAVAATLLLVAGVMIVGPQARAPGAASTPSGLHAAAHPSAITLPPTPEPLPATSAAIVDDRRVHEPAAERRVDRSSRPAGDRLAEEVALLDRAQALLTAGDAAGALALLAEHGHRFSDGALIDLRESAQVQALCLQGDPSAAARAAEALVLTHPHSAVAQRHKNFNCPR